MGRGRAKAKQTKVARELKYHSPNTDLAALQRELASRELAASGKKSEEEIEERDPYAEYAPEDADDENEDDDPGWSPRR